MPRPAKKKTNNRRRVAVIGGAGYTGSELLRILLGHPHVEVVRITSPSHEGQPVWRVHPIFRGTCDLAFEDLGAAEAARDVDLAFCALPSRALMKAIHRFPPEVRIIDLSGDFRLKDPAVYRKYHGKVHGAPELLGQFEYGLSEYEAERIEKARFVANPGAFATAALLALLPLVADGMLTGPVVLNGVIGSSEFGAEARAATHYPERAEAFRAFRMADHPHLPEIVQQLQAHGAASPEITFVPHSAPMVRGLFLSVYVRPLRTVSRDVARRTFQLRYEGKPFVRLQDGSPDCNTVCGSNYADISVDTQGSTIVILVAIDNLVKGAAGQAIQNMNRMYGWDERLGLEFPGMRP